MAPQSPMSSKPSMRPPLRHSITRSAMCESRSNSSRWLTLCWGCSGGANPAAADGGGLATAPLLPAGAPGPIGKDERPAANCRLSFCIGPRRGGSGSSSSSSCPIGIRLPAMGLDLSGSSGSRCICQGMASLSSAMAPARRPESREAERPASISSVTSSFSSGVSSSCAGARGPLAGSSKSAKRSVILWLINPPPLPTLPPLPPPLAAAAAALLT
mmetsp:Transcript_86161/g.184653  ORF Transcript_86161/g.184653 Transcript_86161/m.184653 type:complete len:215 (-) Transcript_86161:282-926(-)